MKPPYETFKKPTCRGCYALGTACGKCEKCEWERKQIGLAQNPDAVEALHCCDRIEFILSDAVKGNADKKCLIANVQAIRAALNNENRENVTCENLSNEDVSAIREKFIEDTFGKVLDNYTIHFVFDYLAEHGYLTKPLKGGEE